MEQHQPQEGHERAPGIGAAGRGLAAGFMKHGPRVAEGGRRHRAMAAVGVALAAVALAAAACSSSPKGPGVAGGGPTTTAAPSAAGGGSPGTMAKLVAYAQCMRSHGIAAFPDPIPNPDGTGGGFNLSGQLNSNSAQFKAANQTCQSLLPGGSSSPEPSAQKIAEEVKLAACMRSHGFPSFPDPNGQGAFDFSGIDNSSAQFQSAVRTCQSAVSFSGPIPVAGGSSGNGS